MHEDFLSAETPLFEISAGLNSNYRADRPLRSDVLSKEELIQFAANLADGHEIVFFHKEIANIYPRFEDNARVLEESYFILAKGLKENSRLSPAGEWFLDNYHVIEQHIREIRKLLPKKYYRSLPVIKNNKTKHNNPKPRIYILVLALVAHSDSVVDSDLLSAFISSYQEKLALTIGELWALPIMLRLALIENLRRLAISDLKVQDAERKMQGIIDSIIHEGLESPTQILLELAGAIKAQGTLSSSDSASLIRQLREAGPQTALALNWFEQWLTEKGQNIDELLGEEWFSKAANQISIGNSFTSLKSILLINWKKWVEKNSLVDEILKQDPADIYFRCDFETRNRYRSKIEGLARSLKCSEIEVAERLISFIRSKELEITESLKETDKASEKYLHVGFYLIDDGLQSFEQYLGFYSKYQAITKILSKRAFGLYQYSVLLLILTFLFVCIFYLSDLQASLWSISLLGLLLFIPISDLAISVMNWSLTHLVPPNVLVKLDYSSGVPEKSKTLVVVHTIFSNKVSIASQVEFLEVRYLANTDPQIDFAILADYGESSTEVKEEDQDLLDYAIQKIAELNNKYSPEQTKFFLLTRKRVWNTSQNKFLGWERKRGKITELNLLITGDQQTTFIVNVGTAELLRKIKYVLTLDTDTSLPHGTAHRLIGTLAHPLNFAEFDSKLGIVTKGYGILQPRVDISLTSSLASRFSKIFAGEGGVDPYTMAVSDLYQDLFCEGSFVGKGIYNVEVFEKALAGRVPENAILSHDLFEGLFARVGLVTDVELFDEFPKAYQSFARRQHRWVRGDWQLLPWMFRKIPNEKRELVRSPLNGLGYWKLIDNLRRSLMAPSCLALLLLSWFLNFGDPLTVTALILLVISFPVYASLANTVVSPPIGLSLSGYLKDLFKGVLQNLLQVLIIFSTLPVQAWSMVNAISLTVFRLYVSRKNLLDWETASQADARLKSGFLATIFQLFPAIFTGIGTYFLLEISLSPNLNQALPVLLLWTLSPILIYWTSFPPRILKFKLSKDDSLRLNQFALESWKFFEQLANEESNFLIPDNIQLYPQKVTAFRTSPTNIGLHYLSIITAVDLGLITLPNAVYKLTKSLETLNQLERFNGHFFNWYDLKTLIPLEPRYISTVDSGNLVGNLIVLKSACNELYQQPIVSVVRLSKLKQLINNVRHQQSEIKTFAELFNFFDQIEPLRINYTEDVGELSSEMLETIHSVLEFQKLAPLLNGLKEFLKIADSLNDSAIHLAEKLKLSPISSLKDLVPTYQQIILEIEKFNNQNLKFSLQESLDNCLFQIQQIEFIQEVCTKLISEIDFQFLYDKTKKLFYIGYQVSEGKFDTSYYDLLASESRLASLIAIAKRDVPQEHWFSLERPLTRTTSGKVLLSWSGTMFEYLMPVLLTKNFPNTLLNETYRVVVNTQRQYTAGLGIPWGISESAYARVDFEHTYQYRAFGVSGLGLKRGLAEDLVISPYSTFLSLQINPQAALTNLAMLEASGLRGEFGFYEAIDYTPDRLNQKESGHVIKSFMAHHQGMSLLAINNLLNNNIMQERFHSDPLIKSVELLLQEKFPERSPITIPHQAEIGKLKNDDHLLTTDLSELITTPHTVLPRTRILSNGYYNLMIDNAGSGYSFLPENYALTRWQEDSLRNYHGNYIFIKDLHSKKIWSTSYQPTRKEPEIYEVIFNADKIEFKRRDYDIFLHTEITISPEDHTEIRKVTITNLSRRRRNLQLTSFSEIVLNRINADEVHPAYSKLFIESELVEDLDALVFKRRKHAPNEPDLYFLHMLSMNQVWGPTEYETNREAFVGRGRNNNTPMIFDNDEPLSGKTGNVLDPIASLRTRVEIEPNKSETVTFLNIIGRTKEDVVSLAHRYQDPRSIKRSFEMAWSKSNIEFRTAQVSVKRTHLFQHLANALFFQHYKFRAESIIIAKNRLVQANLWRFGISGDLPIVLVKIGDSSHLELVAELLNAHKYLANRSVNFDLLIINQSNDGYLQNINQSLEHLVKSKCAASIIEAKAGVFIRNLKQISSEEFLLLKSVARVTFNGEKGDLESQLQLPGELSSSRADRRGTLDYIFKEDQDLTTSQLSYKPSDLEFHNGLGGFIDQGKAYALQVKSSNLAPVPWINVVANRNFGFTISESGSGYTWSENCRENRLSTWSNDPVSDRPSEVVYLRDMNTGAFWSPTPLPIRSTRSYQVEHHQGYSIFKTISDHIYTELIVSGSMTENIKWWSIKIKNLDSRPRHVEVYLYVEWVLGVLRHQTQPFISTTFDPKSEILTAQNFYNNEFSESVAYLGSNTALSSYTTSRTEFIGRNHTLSSPVILEDNVSLPSLVKLAKKANFTRLVNLSRETGTGIDSCGALKVNLSLDPKDLQEVIFYLGVAKNLTEARNQAKHQAKVSFKDHSLTLVKDYWSEASNKIQIKSPDRSFDILMNSWLTYQCLSARIFGRTGFYQSGGAYGFRDQLQDGIALVHSKPEITRELIARAASRQFVEGDVQHWWHPPTGRGIRTKISDNYLWMPYIAAKYLAVTEDYDLLDEQSYYLEGPLLAEGQLSSYFEPRVSEKKESIYEHCLLAIRNGFQVGEHGLPLIGAGDWNDGLNHVGHLGKGESIWLAWFLIDIINKWIPIVKTRSSQEVVEELSQKSTQLKSALAEHGWDGHWYRRAYFDDGTPVGSAGDPECQIDSISQSWAVISGGAPDEQAREAMDSLYEKLVDSENKLMPLLLPPFDQGETDPGYIKAYPPGIRENGGQYTHAATWAIIASAMLGHGNKATELFSMINPINHTSNSQGVKKYRAEPYVTCGDVYSQAPYVGRAGWSWYTGSCGWLYQAGLNHILGFKVAGNKLTINPCIPKTWDKFQINYEYQNTKYIIEVENPSGVETGILKVILNGSEVGQEIELLENLTEVQSIKILMG